MRATISGVTHKNNVVVNHDETKNFLDKQKNIFKKLCSSSNVVYDKQTVVSDAPLNYLNVLPEDSVEESLKNIILKEYYDCEKLYPYLGDYLLHTIFNSKSVSKGQVFVFEKRNQKKFIESINNKHVVEIANWVFNNINMNRSINVEPYQGKDLCVELSLIHI